MDKRSIVKGLLSLFPDKKDEIKEHLRCGLREWWFALPFYMIALKLSDLPWQDLRPVKFTNAVNRLFALGKKHGFDNASPEGLIIDSAEMKKNGAKGIHTPVVVFFKKLDSIVNFWAVMGFGLWSDTMITWGSRLPLLTVPAFQKLENQRILSISEQEWLEMFGYRIKDKFDGQAFMAGICYDLLRVWFPTVSTLDMTLAFQVRLIQKLTPSILRDQKNIAVKALVTQIDTLLLRDVLKFCKAKGIKKPGPYDIITSDDNVKLGADGKSHSYQRCVGVITNIPKTDSSCSLGLQSMMHWTRTETEVFLAAIGMDELLANVSKCFNPVAKVTKLVTLGAHNAVAKLAAGGVFPDAVFTWTTSTGKKSRDMFHEYLMRAVRDMSRICVKAFGRRSYMISGGNWLNDRCAIFAWSMIVKVGPNLERTSPEQLSSEEALLKAIFRTEKELEKPHSIFDWILLDRNPSINPDGQQTQRRDDYPEDMRRMVTELTYKQFMKFYKEDKLNLSKIPWRKHMGHDLVMVEGYMFSRSNCHIVPPSWAINVLLGDYDGDKSMAMLFTSERVSSYESHELETTKRTGESQRQTIRNMLVAIAKAELSAKAIPIGSAAISWLCEKYWFSKYLINKLGADFMTVCHCVNSFVDLNKVDIVGKVVNGVEIKDLDTMLLALVRIIMPNLPEERAFKPARKDYMACVLGRAEYSNEDGPGVKNYGYAYQNWLQKCNKEIVEADIIANAKWRQSPLYGTWCLLLKDALITRDEPQRISHADMLAMIPERRKSVMVDVANCVKYHNENLALLRENTSDKLVVLDDLDFKTEFRRNHSEAGQAVKHFLLAYEKIARMKGYNGVHQKFGYELLGEKVDAMDSHAKQLFFLGVLEADLTHKFHNLGLSRSLDVCTGEFWEWMFEDYSAETTVNSNVEEETVEV